jgi:hypothetical protein
MNSNWLKKWSSYTAVLGSLGALWTAAQWCQHTTDLQVQLQGQQLAGYKDITKRLDEMRQDNSALRGYASYQSRRIDTLQSNEALMNRYVHAPQVPMPQPDAAKQKQDSSGQSVLDSEPTLSKSLKPIPPILALDR